MMTPSINQIAGTHAAQTAPRPQQNAYGTLPNFRNLGIVLRILLSVNLLVMLAAIIKAPTLDALGPQLMEVAALVEPLLILSLVMLYLLNDLLARMTFATATFLIVAITLALTVALYFTTRGHLPIAMAGLGRYLLLVGLTTAMLLAYFDLRGRALSPALSEARLQALQARIRPHFLFNSINAVLSLIRQDPRRAESALEDMAELFRVLMADNRELTPLMREVQLCKQYLNIEQLRLGERLQVEWHIDNMPGDALIPPLVLQPLLENAVYHGVEPRSKPGAVSINLYASRDQVHAVLKNPFSPGGSHHAGNKMAISNIRERLQLHFDAEASMTTRVTGDAYQVHIVMPYRREKAA